MNKLIILDRDGVINYDSPDFIKSPDEWIPIPGSLEAIVKLNKAGIKVAVATNQSGLARGLFDLVTLNEIHHKMQSMLKKLGGQIDLIVFCSHHPDEACNCRKPQPGLILQIFQHFNLAPHPSILAIGDSLRDLQAASSAGCQPVLALTGNGPKTLSTLPEEFKNIKTYPDLSSAINAFLENEIHVSSK